MVSINDMLWEQTTLDFYALLAKNYKLYRYKHWTTFLGMLLIGKILRVVYPYIKWNSCYGSVCVFCMKPRLVVTKITGFSTMYETLNWLGFWVLYYETTYKWGLFASYVEVYIIDLWACIVETCDWMVMSIYHFGKGILMFVFVGSHRLTYSRVALLYSVL